MAEVLYPTQGNFDGPWLIPSTALFKLDEIIDEFWPRLEEVRDTMFLEEVEERTNKRIEKYPKLDKAEVEADMKEFVKALSGYSERRQVTLSVEGGKTLKIATFKEAQFHPEIQDCEVSGFLLSFKCGPIKCDVQTWSDRSINIDVGPQGAEVSRELYTAIRSWTKSVSPSRPLAFWKAASGAQWGFFLAVLFIIGAIITPNSHWKQEAQVLLDHGINSAADQQKVNELLLKIASDYTPPSQRLGLPFWFKMFAFAGFVTCGILSITPPKLLIGLGSGDIRLRRWRWWIRFAFLSIPLFILTTFARMFLQRLIS